MKLFQQLLVAPAALGLLAPLAVVNSPAAHAGELNINGVSDYAASADQVTSVTQFSDIYPTDWAYQALAGLVETYGCVAGYPNGTFRGNRAMTRYEAAALLNACLDRVTEVTDELRRLLKEFETELAILKGRVDGLEARVGELEATQFSTTTKLKGKATFVTGAMDSEDAGAQADDDAFSFSYDYRLGLKTSFTGKDLLFARLRAGNMKDGSAFSGGFRKLDVSGMSGNTLKLDRLYYKFPVGSGITAIAGPMARNTESLGMKPTAYTVKTLNMFGGQFGAGNVYNKETGGLVGVIWKQKVAKGEPRLTAALNYVADDGEQASSEKGMFTAKSKGNTTAQIGYGTKKWGAALGYRYGQCGAGFGTAYKSVSQSCGSDNVDSQNFALNGFWKPEETGFIPSVSLAYGWSDLEGSTVDEARTWMVGLQWDKVANTPHSLAVGFGAPLYVESQDGTDPDAPELAWEASLKYKVSSNITMIPAIFYLPESNSSQGVSGKEQFGAVLQTVFKF